MFLYALHIDSDPDAKRIQSLQEFLGLPVSSSMDLSVKSLEEVETLHTQLHGTYENRFKQG